MTTRKNRTHNNNEQFHAAPRRGVMFNKISQWLLSCEFDLHLVQYFTNARFILTFFRISSHGEMFGELG